MQLETFSGLPRTVRTNHGDAGHTGRLQADVEDGRRLAGRVLVGHVRQLHERLGFGLHTLQRAGDREGELQLILQLQLWLLPDVYRYLR